MSHCHLSLAGEKGGKGWGLGKGKVPFSHALWLPLPQKPPLPNITFPKPMDNKQTYISLPSFRFAILKGASTTWSKIGKPNTVHRITGLSDISLTHINSINSPEKVKPSEHFAQTAFLFHILFGETATLCSRAYSESTCQVALTP